MSTVATSITAPRRPVVIKIGRNQLCPCGSGKKYKRCPGSNTALPPPQPPASKDDIQQMIQRHEAAERIRQNQQGFGRPIVSFRAFDRQIVAVGDTIYHSTNWKTFPDFLAHYMKTVLGSDWGNAELKKPVADRHPIVQWYDVVCRYQADTIKGKGKVAAAPMIGAVACYLGTAYNLYLLKHNVELQGRLVKRLKNPEQFQGAYHELMVANILIRAGFDLTLEDETDGETKHCEFAAVSKKTGKRYWVEAKMRAVEGLLGRTDKDGGNDRDVLSRLIPHLNQAFKKPAEDDRLIFIDINGEPESLKDGKFVPDWVDRALKRFEQYEIKELPGGEDAYVFVTNLPFHRTLNGPLSIMGVPIGVGIADFNRPGNYRLSEAHRLKQKHIDAYNIGDALLKYPQLPTTFDGSLPSETLHGDKSRVIIGETYHFDGINGDGLIAKVATATVDEAKKQALIGTDSGAILSYPMSDEALADYKANPDAYFGRLELSSTKQLPAAISASSPKRGSSVSPRSGATATIASHRRWWRGCWKASRRSRRWRRQRATGRARRRTTRCAWRAPVTTIWPGGSASPSPTRWWQRNMSC
jgi:hypothetical protein